MADVPDKLMSFKDEESRLQFIKEMKELPAGPTPSAHQVAPTPNARSKWILRQVFYYANDWALAMERELAAGARLADIAKRTRDEVDPDNKDAVTIFMHTIALNVMCKWWAHGPALIRWWNVQLVGPVEGLRRASANQIADPSRITARQAERMGIDVKGQTGLLIAAYRDLQDMGVVP